ncbi:MAG: phospholipase D family protein [Bacteroidia bacterium]|nr:phospholipase D family protein [Bacteroidia bacterium]
MKMPLRLCALIFLSTFIISCGSENELVPEQKSDFCDKIHRNDSMSLSKELEPFEKLMDKQTGVYVLEDGDAAMTARAWLSEYAEKSLDIQYFIFATDNVGLIACDYIVRAADRGVKVRILVDDIMVEAGVHEILMLDSHENIDIKIYNPGTNLGKNFVQKVKKLATDFRGANQRMHNKTFTIDGKVVITGGRNIADEYFDYDHEYNFRDRDVLLLGKLCKDVNRSFEEFWNDSLSVDVTKLVKEEGVTYSDSSRFDRLHAYACNPENFWPQVREKISMIPKLFKALSDSGKVVWTDSICFVSDKPGKNDGSEGLGGGGITTDTLVNIIMHAKRCIDIQSPYLITTEQSRKLFADAVKRGVKVRILTNSLCSTDNTEAFSGYQKSREALLKTGVRIFEMRPDAKKRYEIMTGALQQKLNYAPVFGLHAKSMVVDGNITVIGTFNLDPRSSNLNTECITVICSAKVSRGVELEMDSEFLPENSWETTLDSNPDEKAGVKKRANAMIKKVIPNKIL